MPLRKSSSPQLLAPAHVSLLFVEEKLHEDALIALMEKLQGKRLLFISLNRGFAAMQRLLRKNRVPARQVHFLDCVSSSFSRNLVDGLHCTFLGKESSFTAISLKLSAVLEKEFDVLVFDSLNALLLSEQRNYAERFVSLLAHKISMTEMTGVFVTVGIPSTQVFSSLKPFSGRVFVWKHGFMRSSIAVLKQLEGAK